MNPIYRFYISKDGATAVEVHPNYGDDLSIEWAKESEQMFHRRSLSDGLTFTGVDYDLIMPTPSAYGSEFDIEIQISYDNGANWATYWTGVFYHTDCEIDLDNKILTVTPNVKDDYIEILAGMEKEYNLIDLEPPIHKINLVKRPIIQVYKSGETRISCYVGGMYWEQECQSIFPITTLNQDYHFSYLGGIYDLSFTSVVPGGTTTRAYGYWVGIKGTLNQAIGAEFYDSNYHYISYVNEQFDIKRRSDDALLWSGYLDSEGHEAILLSQTSEADVKATLVSNSSDNIFMRYITDATTIDGTSTYALSDSDIVSDNRNYSHVIGFYAPELISYTDTYSTNPTKWGKHNGGGYYKTPLLEEGVTYLPIAKSLWGNIAWWFEYSSLIDHMENKGETLEELRDAYKLSDVINLLLSKFCNLTFGSQTSSEFLNGSADPITEAVRTFFITPKTNVKKIDYDNPATNATITLKQLLDMLRDCFKCYWFVDNGELRIEHIKYFMQGGDYSGTQGVGINLTTSECVQNGKHLDFGQNKITFDKAEMTARYEFSWMDEATLPFKGEPINMVGPYINKDKIDKIEVSQFSADIDYILMNPADISDDGFVLMGAKLIGGEWTLPMMAIEGVSRYYLQNPYCAFIYTQTYYRYDMPTRHYTIGDYPKAYDIDPYTQSTIGGSIMNGIWQQSATNDDFLIDVTTFRGDSMTLMAGTAGRMYYTFVKAAPVWGEAPVYATGYYTWHMTTNETTIAVPNDAVYLVVLALSGGTDYRPRMIVVDSLVSGEAESTKRNKSQTVQFPCYTDLDTKELIVTSVGNGVIESLNLNLSSRYAEAVIKFSSE